jgi:hypothetical protein
MATTLKTNKKDYAPGATVTLTLDGIATGSSYVFAAFDLASDPGDDGVANLYPKFSATDGGWGDLDGLRNGQIITQWVVPVDPDGIGPQRAPAWNATVQVTATPVVAFGPSGLPTNATSNVVASTTFTDALPAPIQTYFVPLRETNLLTTFDTINAAADSPITTLISIAVAAPGTVIYYDHWEDGYEPDVTTAVQSTTLIWGDGNLLNGIAPGTGGSDMFLGGESIVLSNPVPIPRNAANILFDGADLIKASFPIAVVRAAFPGPGSVGSLLAGGVEVFDTDSWGDDFIAPVGQNTPNLSGTSPFEYTALYVMAGTPNTPVYLNGVLQTTLLNAGDNFVIRVNEDARITTFDPDNATSGRDVQVHLVTGDIGSSYEMRWYALAPRDDWSNDYYTPVGDSVGATRVWLYNPNDDAITVRYDFFGGSSPDSSINVAAHSAALSPAVPNGSGARFYSDSNADGVADGPDFFALTQTDTGASAGSTGQLFDWGHPLIPASELTSQVVVGLGFGNTTNDSDIASRSVVWVTPVKDATIHIDFDGDGMVDATVSATALQSIKIIDNTTTGNDGTNPPGQVAFPPVFTGAEDDQDMSGAIIFATDSNGDPVDIAVAWGQDPARSFSGDGDALDLGTVVIPLPVVEAGKSASLFTDLNSNGKFDPGDTIQYTITVLNFSRVDLPAGGYNVLDYDTPVFDDASYVADSTKYTYNNGATTVAVPDSGATLFPLDEAGFTSTELLPGGESQTFTFLVTIDDYTNLAAGTDTIVNEGVLRVNGQTIDVFDATVPINFDANIHIEKSTNGIDADSVTGPYITTGSLVTWTYEVTTTAGSVYLADIMVTDDVLGVTPLYQSGDVDDDGILKPGETWVYQATGTAATGQYTNMGTATGTPVYADGTTPIEGATKPTDTDPSHYFGVDGSIQIVKTAGSAADGAVLTTTAGDVLYTYVVSNTGNADLSGVSVVDDNGTAGVPGDDVTIGTIPSLAIGASVTLTSTFSVTGDRTNIATATGDTPDGGTVSDDDDAVVDVIAPAIQIVKTAGSAADGAVLTTTAGDVLYTYVVSNTGDADLSDVSVVDDNGTAGVPGDDVVIGTIPSLAAGASVTLTSTFSVTGDRTNIATATGDTPDGGTVSDDDDAVVDVIAPAIQIVKTAGSAADGAVLTTTAGDVLYTYVVSNTGDADLSDVSVVDDNGTAGVPGDDVTIGTIPSLAAGASVTLTSTFSVTGDRTNIATATGDTPDGGTVSDDDDAVVDVIAPAIQIVKTAGSAADGAVLTTTAGDVLYTYVVSNTGDADLSDVSVVDDNGTAGVPGDDVVIGTIPSLAAGASVTLTSTFSVTGDRTNIATATGDTPDGGTVSDDDDAVVDVIAPAIQIVKTAGSAADGAVLTTTAGDVLYTYVVSNTGDADLSDVSVVDDNGTAGVPGDDVVIGTIPSLAAGASVTLTSTFSVTGDRTNIATATGDTPDGGTVSDDDDAVVDVIAPAIQIVKTAGSAADGAVLTTTAGDVLYTYVVSNTGDADLSDVSVVDDNGTAGVPGDDVTIGTIPSLAAGASVTLTSTFSVTGDRTNIATATGDTPDGGTVSDDDDAVVDVIAPAIQIVKTAGSAADGAVLTTTAGDVLYTYVVSNTGDADLSDVSVVDDNGTAGVPGDDVTIGTIPSLAAGASVTLTSTFSVTGDRTNIATATGDTPDGGTVSDDDDAVVDVIAPAIQIVKTAGSAADGAVLTTTAGDVLYTYVVSNTGDADLSDVSVVDDNGTAGVPGDDVTIGTIPSLAAGASVTLTSTFSVTGDRTNIATATGDTPDGGTVSDDDDAVVDVIAPAIQIVKTAGSAADGAVLTTTAGDVLYTYVVSNTGDADLSDVSVVDDNGTAGVPGDDVTIGTIPSLAAGASVTLTSTFSVTGDRTNIATATGDTPDGGTVSDDDDAVVDVIAPAIQIVKTAGSAADGAVLTTTAGDVLYTYVVSNTGDADLSDVSVVDDNGTAGVPGDDVTIGTIPSLAAGASVTLTSTFSVTGDRTNIATATGDTPDGGTVSDDDDAVVDVIAPAIQIVKTAGSAADGAVLTTTAGDVLYTYVVSNTGDADLSDVSVVDDNGTAGVPGDDVTIGTIPSLAAGASVTLTSTFSVTGDRTNIATATGDTPDGGTVSDDDDAVVHIEQRGSIGDRVWQDMNYNGIQDPGEPGLGGFVVNLLDASGSPTGLSMNTDASGNYLFSDLAAGDYRIQVLAQPGYYYTKPNVGPDDLDSDVDSSGVTSIINLSPGESELDWDAGLYRKATLGDRVWLDRDKDGIQDANEAGVGHVVVTLLDAGGGVLATTTTDVFGNYLFSNLDPGTYGLEFDKALAKTGAISVAKYPWTLQNAGGNPNLDSDVEADPGNPNLAFTTAPIVLTSGENDLSWDAGITPIVIDLNGDGIHTISRADSQGTFDLLGTGAGIKSGWLSGEDGFLVIDGNANDRIDDISEMFGGSQKGDGFAKLASFDSNRDGVVDASDADFASLKVWQDANGNHQTDAGELISLADAGVLSLSLDFTELPFRDAQDNLHLERSSATLSDGAVVDMTDVYLNVSTFDAAAAGVSLPSLGELMSSDNSLDSLWSNPELDWVSQEDQPLETTSAADTFGGTPMDYSVDASGAAGLSTLEVQPQFACCDLF